MMQGIRLKVLSVTGAGRSGTTVLASILDGVEGFVGAGEMRRLWERGVGEGRPCGCGLPPDQCPIWGPIVARTLAITDPPERALHQIVAAQHELMRGRNRLRVLRSARGGHHDWAALRTVRGAMGTACRQLADATGAHVVVDTSKRAEDAAVLATVPDVDHHVLHMVRDPRAVVHSWRRPKTFATAGTTRTMQTRRLPSTTRRWIENCLSTEVLLRRVPRDRWLRVRYEDFARDPRAVMGQILALLNATGDLGFEDAHSVQLRPNHIVAGNPSRFTTGVVTIRSDEEWRSRMPRRDQRIVALATAPLMARYGYSPTAGRDGAQ